MSAAVIASQSLSLALAEASAVSDDAVGAVVSGLCVALAEASAVSDDAVGAVVSGLCVV